MRATKSLSVIRNFIQLTTVAAAFILLVPASGEAQEPSVIYTGWSFTPTEINFNQRTTVFNIDFYYERRYLPHPDNPEDYITIYDENDSDVTELFTFSNFTFRIKNFTVTIHAPLGLSATGYRMGVEASFPGIVGNTPLQKLFFDFPTIETIQPTIISIVRQYPVEENTSANLLAYRVTFSEAVTQVDRTDFTVVGGSTAAILTAPQAGVGNRTWDVFVNGGDLADNTYDGPVGLGLAPDQNIQDDAGNPLAGGIPGNAHTHNRSPLQVIDAIFDRTSVSTENNGLGVQLVFNFPVLGFSSDNVAVVNEDGVIVSNTATPGGFQITSGASQGNDAYRINWSVQDGISGIYRIRVSDDPGYLSEHFTPGLEFTSAPFAVDTIRPTLSSIARQNPVDEITNAATLTFRVTFSEHIANANASDFTVTGGSTAMVSDVQRVGGESRARDVTVSDGNVGDNTYNGEVGLGLATTAAIRDQAGNALTDAAATGFTETYSLDNTQTQPNPPLNPADAPFITAITRLNPGREKTNADSLTWEVTFNQPVTGVDGGDFTVSNQDGTTLAEPLVGGGGDTYTVTTSDAALARYDGMVSLAPAAGRDITSVDSPGAPLRDFDGPAEHYLLDNTPPELLEIIVTHTTMGIGQVTPVVFLFVENDLEPLTPEDITVSPDTGGEITGLQSGDVQYIGIFTAGSQIMDEVILTLAAENYRDQAGNQGATTRSTTLTITDDPTPTVRSEQRTATGGNPLAVTIIFDQNVIDFDDADDITVVNGTVAEITSVDDNQQEYMVNIIPDSQGSVMVSVEEGVAINPETRRGNLASNQLVLPLALNQRIDEADEREPPKMLTDFMLRRGAHIMAARPDLTGLLDGSGMGTSSLRLDAGPTRAFKFAGTGAEISGLFDKGRGDRSLNEGDRAKARDDNWVSLEGIRTRTDHAEDEFYSLSVGGHRRMGDDRIVGGFVALDLSNADGRGAWQGEQIDGRGWLVGPYLAGRLAERGLYYQVHAAWGRSSNFIDLRNAAESKFKTERYLAGASLKGKYQAGPWTLSPALSADWYREQQRAYMSEGTRIAGRNIALGEIRAGPEFHRMVHMDNGAELWVKMGAQFVYTLDVQADDDHPITFEDGDIRARLGMNFDYVLGDTRISLGLRYDGIGQTDYESWGADLRVKVAF